jgi:hypothetical protein
MSAQIQFRYLVTYDRWVVRDLLDYEDGLTSTILVGPSSVEKFT